MTTIQRCLCLTLMAVLVSNVAADEKKGKGAKRSAKKPTPTQQFLAQIELTDAQKEKVAEIDKQFAERFDAGRKVMDDILTADQKKAQRESQKAAKEAGKKGPEARKEVETALKLTDEQKAKRTEQQKVQAKLNQEIVAELKKVLTEEQQANLPKNRSANEGGKKKKKDAA